MPPTPHAPPSPRFLPLPPQGDSFIFAFHSALDAILFSVESQEALMEGDWPAQLLAQPLCRPLWVTPLGAEQGVNNFSTVGACYCRGR